MVRVTKWLKRQLTTSLLDSMREIVMHQNRLLVAVLVVSSASLYVPYALRGRAQGTLDGDVCPSEPTETTVTLTGETYRRDRRRPRRGFFTTGQNADLVLSHLNFNRTGGGNLFNHPASMATDGTRLILADTFNNRVLVWRTPPDRNVPPDFVLGQRNKQRNEPGTGRDQMNWPTQVTTDGRHLAVADTMNERILIWTDFPTRTGEAADVVLESNVLRQQDPTKYFDWPWGVWTDGRKLVVAGTQSSSVLIWNRIPAADNISPDIAVTNRRLGTPRTITSDGTTLIVGDHNANVPGKSAWGTFFWRTFPTADNAPPDFFLDDPYGGWLHGTFTQDGTLLGLDSAFKIWNTVPVDENDAPDVVPVLPWSGGAGDYAGVAVAEDRVYVVSGNANRIVVYDSMPTQNDTPPDFAIGSPSICTNTLVTNHFITNPVPASDGQSLFVSSDFDNRLSVWTTIPGESGAPPDIIYQFPAGGDGPWDNGIDTRAFALAGGQTVLIWQDLPLAGELPDRTLTEHIGSVELQELRGVAIDRRNFYLADRTANKVYVWTGIPSSTSEPAFSLDVAGPDRVASDGTYLVVVSPNAHSVLLYEVKGLSARTEPTVVGGQGVFNLPQGAFASNGRLFVADTGNSQIHVWSKIADALDGQSADIVLGEASFEDTTPEIKRDKTFWPAAPFYDGELLWVGEFKFSNRLLRFAP